MPLVSLSFLDVNGNARCLPNQTICSQIICWVMVQFGFQQLLYCLNKPECFSYKTRTFNFSMLFMTLTDLCSCQENWYIFVLHQIICSKHTHALANNVPRNQEHPQSFFVQKSRKQDDTCHRGPWMFLAQPVSLLVKKPQKDFILIHHNQLH